jgi:hypothetical protein
MRGLVRRLGRRGDSSARQADRAGDGGSIALELAIIAPMLIGIILLMLAYGRQPLVRVLGPAAAPPAARAATHARSFDDAQDRVEAAVEDNLWGAPPTCRESSGFTMGDRAAFMAGAVITVEVWCDVSFADVGLPLATQRLTRSFTSRLDPYRGVR